MDTLQEALAAINSKDDFVAFVTLLLHDLEEGPADWPNDRLETYIDAIGNWTEDMDEFYSNGRMPAAKEYRLESICYYIACRQNVPAIGAALCDAPGRLKL